MVDSGKENASQLNHYGSGPNIGRDNYGNISYEMLGPGTKSMLEKLDKLAPELAALLTRALRDGIISPDDADMLMFAARNINEDVADMLVFAGRNINWDVANKFVQVKDELSETASELDRIWRSLHATVGQIGSLQGSGTPEYQLEPAGTAGVVAWPSPRSADKWRVRFGLICCSAGAGLVAAVILMRSHQGGWAVVVGIGLLVVAALLQYWARLRSNP